MDKTIVERARGPWSHFRRPDIVPLLHYLQEKLDMGLIGEVALFTERCNPTGTCGYLRLEKVKQKIFGKLLRPGIRQIIPRTTFEQYKTADGAFHVNVYIRSRP